MADKNVVRYGLYDVRAKKFLILNSKEELKHIFILLEETKKRENYDSTRMKEIL